MEHSPKPRAEFERDNLTAEIAIMLDDLGNPPLVDKIFPKGWRNADDSGLRSLYDLCARTYTARRRSLAPLLKQAEG